MREKRRHPSLNSGLFLAQRDQRKTPAGLSLYAACAAALRRSFLLTLADAAATRSPFLPSRLCLSPPPTHPLPNFHPPTYPQFLVVGGMMFVVLNDYISAEIMKAVGGKEKG